jgi:PPK2 family polyphosphate:nucleotide phosphotransferase
VAEGYAFRVEPGANVRLADHDPGTRAGLSRTEGTARLSALLEELDKLQQQLYGAGRNAVLLILQGLDSSGKDGAIRKVISGMSPQGVLIRSFKAPTEEELAHDFLWRIHRVVPRLGMLAVFNRSHYEDVLVPRVHELVPRAVWHARYAYINNFEELLSASGTIIVKCYLHISRKEQEERLLAREADVNKAWKLSADDWREREHWADYQAAYEAALSACSTSFAPWYIVPADHKWFRDLALADVLVRTLRTYSPEWREALEQMARERLPQVRAVRGAT